MHQKFENKFFFDGTSSEYRTSVLSYLQLE